MPFDPLPPPTRKPVRNDSANARLRPVALWLFALCGMILVMITLGGATRLTGSGLSIMEWAPLMGTLPPLSEAEWQRLYGIYQQIPQYALVNQGFGIDGFRQIFWLEWSHRLWGRLMGAALFLPLLWFTVRGVIDRGLFLRLAGILILGGLQGAVGWFMVESGFTAETVSVSAYRLVAHLALATALYAALLWTALSVWRQASGPAAGRSTAGIRYALTALCVLVTVTILAGGFVAGLHAGLTYNSFPFMDGRLVPDGYGLLNPAYLNLFENVAAVQFNHRALATLTGATAAGIAILGIRRATGSARRALIALACVVALQYALGVLTLLWVVPIALGTAHQAMAMVVLTLSLVALHIHHDVASGRRVA